MSFRYDISFPNWQACKCILRYLKGTMQYVNLFKLADRLCLEGYVDAYYASCLDDRRLTSGYRVYLGGNWIALSSKKLAICFLIQHKI